MASCSVETVTKLESLPQSEQDRVLEHLREYIQALSDELRWNDSFEGTQAQLIEAAGRAREEFAGGQAEPMDYHRL